MTIWKLFIGQLSSVLFFLHQAQLSYGAETFHGVVIDAETKQPLEGAAVVVVWRKQSVFAMDGNQRLHKVVEVTTGSDGGFSVADEPGTNFNIMASLEREPDITIYYPGYRPFPFGGANLRVSPEQTARRISGRDERNDALRRGAIVELPKETNLDEMTSAPGGALAGVGMDTPESAIPHLLQLIAIERGNIRRARDAERAHNRE